MHADVAACERRIAGKVHEPAALHAPGQSAVVGLAYSLDEHINVPALKFTVELKRDAVLYLEQTRETLAADLGRYPLRRHEYPCAASI